METIIFVFGANFVLGWLFKVWANLCMESLNYLFSGKFFYGHFQRDFFIILLGAKLLNWRFITLKLEVFIKHLI